MACEPALMTQEQDVVRALGSVTGFGIDGQNNLVLLGGDTPRIVAKRR